MSFMRLTLLALAVTLSSQNLFAHSALESWFDQTTSFRSCSNDQTNFVRSTIITGLERIDLINPVLLKDRISFTAGYKATFSCDANAKLVAGAAAQSQTSRYVSVLGMKLKEARLRNAVIEVGGVFAGHNDSPFKMETVILHEFLHFLKFDNLDTVVHDNPEVYSISDFGNFSEQNYTFDVVFSCSAAAFSDPGEIHDAAHRPEDLLIRAVQTCKDARIDAGKVDVDSSSFTSIKAILPSVRASLRCLTRRRKSPSLAELGASEIQICKI